MPDITQRLSTALADRYRLERHLGEGGMATVYLAQDLKHDRKVAVKVLRPELAAVLGAERFVQEIKTTAALQHPHILPLFDSGTADGFLFYVMPFIDGETLRDKLSRERQFGIEEAVRITRDVADALDYAHRHGVIHRDIKPENILIHDGRPMVADFGIALAVSAAAGGRMTETGLSLGTPHYMSPEQATADKNVTNRSDVYSLGCMLYEMLTGDPPHTGSSAQAIIMKIVTDDARPVTDLRKSVPPHVAAATAKALEKLAADRFETAKAFADALANPAFALTAATAVSAGTAGTAARTWARPWVVPALLVATAVTAAFAGWSWLRPPPPAPVIRYPTSLSPGDTRDGGGLATQAALSPDGAYLVFRQPASGPGQLHLKRREDLTSQPLAGTDRATGPFFSPDGEWIGFFAGGELRKMPSTGGGSLKLADSVNMLFVQGTWLDDGTIVYSDIPELRRVPSSGGASQLIVAGAQLGGRVGVLPNPLPRARGALFSACAPPSCAESSVHVWDARRDTTRLLFEDALGAWHTATGHILYLTRTGTLLAAPWDNDALAPSGPAVPVLDGIQAPGLLLSREGTAFYLLGPPLFESGPVANAELVWVDRSGRVDQVDPAWRFNTGGGNWGLALSPDGRRLAIRLLTDLGQNIWIKQLPTGPLSRLTFHEGEDRSPMWTRDGRGVTFISTRPVPGDTTERGPFRVWARAADGTGDAALVWKDNNPTEAFWTPDNQWLILRTAGPAGALGDRDIVAVRRGEDSVARRLVAAPYDELGPAVSPDSRWIAYVSNETGSNEVFIRPFPAVQSGKWQVSTSGGTAPVWAHNGRELFYLAGGNMNVVAVHPGPPFTVSEPRVLFAQPERVRGGSAFGHYIDITPDDQRFVMVRNLPGGGPDSTAGPVLVTVQNFLAELRSKMK
jgi:serine/threonine-protein kinase